MTKEPLQVDEEPPHPHTDLVLGVTNTETVEEEFNKSEEHESIRRGDAVDDVLVQALAEGRTQIAAAQRAGVTDRTVRRRLENPDFNRQVREARRRMTEEATGRAAALLGDAVDVIGDILRTAEPATQLRAASMILRVADQAAVMDGLAQRLDELEAVMATADEEDQS